MDSEDLFVETPDYSEELDAMDEPDNYDEAAEKDADDNDDEESTEKTNGINNEGGLSNPNTCVVFVF